MARRYRGLGREDIAAWKRVTKSIEPLQRRACAPLEGAGDRATGARLFAPASQPKRPAPAHDFAPYGGGEAHSYASGLASAMDAKICQRLRRGKLTPEAVLDLHGKSIAQAHQAVWDFVIRAYAGEKRLILAICGKGQNSRRFSAFDGGGRCPTIRGEIADWLSAGAMRPYVLDFRTAHFKHGGDGAYYIYLRRKRP